MAGTVERTFVLKLLGDVGDISKGLGQTDRKLGKTARSAVKWGKALGGALVIGGLERLVDSVGEGVRAFREEQDMVRNFTATTKRMGVPVGRASKALDRMADAAVSLGFDDGDMIRGMDAFVKKTGSIEQATRMNTLAMDIARSKGIDLAAAQKQVGAIYNGSARALKQYGLEGVKGMDAVNKAREVERGKAGAWARNHPMFTMLNQVSDAWADVVGNLARGDIGGALSAGQRIGEALLDGLFGKAGKDSIRNSKTAGLVNQILDELFGEAGKDGIRNSTTKGLVPGITSALGKVDWGKALQDGLSAGLDLLKGAVATLPQWGPIALAIGAALFAVDAIVTAFSTVLGAPGMLVAALVGGAKAGLSFLAGFVLSIAGAIVGAVGIGTLAGLALGAAIIAGVALVIGPQRFVDILLKPVQDSVAGMQQALDGVGQMMGGDVIGGVVTFVTGLGAALLAPLVGVIMTPLDLLNETIKTLFGVDVIGTLGDLVDDFTTKGGEIAGGLVKGIVDGLVGLARDLTNAVIDALNAAITEYNKWGDIAAGRIELLSWGEQGIAGTPFHLDAGSIGADLPAFDLLPDLESIPRLAKGGIVDEPTLAMLGEGRYREAVVPLDGRSMGTTVNLAVTVQAPVGADGARVGQEIMRYIDQALGRGHRFRNRLA